MIKEIEVFEEISGEASPLFPRIFSVYKYKSGSDSTWRQVDENGNTRALLSSLDNNFTVIAEDLTDFEEIEEFLRFQNFSTLISNVPFKKISTTAYSLFKFTDVDIKKSDENFLILNKESSISAYRSFYSVLHTDTEDTDNSFEDWFLGFSNRIVKNDAKAVALKQHECLLSVATVPMIYKNTAIISGVYTLNGFRNKGYSKSTIYKLIDELKRDGVTDIYLWCEKDVEEFYKKIGFEIKGKVYLGVLK